MPESRYRFVVETGKVREFADAVHAGHPDHRLSEGAVAPATFLMASQFWKAPEDSPFHGLDLSRVLHAGQEFEYVDGPPAAGTVLEACSRVERTWSKDQGDGRRLDFTTVLEEFSDDEHVVARMRTTFVVPHSPEGETHG